MKIIKRILLIFLLLILIVVAAGVFTAKYYGDEVKAYLIEELNLRINTQVHVKDVDFSVLEKFPFASVDFSNVIIIGAEVDEQKDTLLEAGHLYLQFSIADIFRKNYRIREIQVYDGKFRPRVSSNGKPNYIFWESGSDSTSNVDIKLEALVLQNMNIDFSNEIKEERILSFAEKAVLSGNFTKEKYDLFIQGTFNDVTYHSKNRLLFDQKKLNLSTSLIIDHKQKEFTVEEGKLKIGEMQFEIAGKINNKENVPELNLTLEGKQINILSALTLIPKDQSALLAQYRGKGRINITVDLSGFVDQRRSPRITANFDIKNGEVVALKHKVALTRINLTGSFTNGERGHLSTSSLQITGFNSQLSNSRLEGAFGINNFLHPVAHIRVKGSADLKKLAGFAVLDTLEEVGGHANFDLSYEGKLKGAVQYTGKDFINSRFKGAVVLNDASFKLKGTRMSVKQLNGALKLENNDASAKSVTGKLGNTDFAINGSLENLVPFLLLENEPVDIVGELKSMKVDLEELLSVKKNNGESNYVFDVSPYVNADLDVDIARLGFRRFSAENITGKVKVAGKKIATQSLAFTSSNGKFDINAIFDCRNENLVGVHCYSNVRALNIGRLFYEFENFSQDFITDKHLSGKADLDIEFHSEFNRSLQIDPYSVKLESDITIKNGKINSLQSLMDVSAYVNSKPLFKIPSLKTVEFSTLKNHVSIDKRVIKIPLMDVNTKDMGLKISGTHTFDNEVDYKINVFLSDVLAIKARERKVEDPDFALKEEDGGKATIPLRMKGVIPNAEISYDKGYVKDKVATQVKGDFKKVKEEIKKDIGSIFKGEKEKPRKETEETRKKNQENSSPKYEIIWEDVPDED